VLGVRGLQWPAVGGGEGRGKREICQKMREESVVFNPGREFFSKKQRKKKKKKQLFKIIIKKILG
jgi:hypothetical protein